MALVRSGIPYEQAWEMSPLEGDRALAIVAGWAIPADERSGGTVICTKSDIDMLYG